LSYKLGLPAEKRELLRIATSNRALAGKTLELTLTPPFTEIANRFQNANSRPYRDIPRTWDALLERLLSWAKLSLGMTDTITPPRD